MICFFAWAAVIAYSYFVFYSVYSLLVVFFLIWLSVPLQMID